MTLLPKTDILTVKRDVRFTPKSGHLGSRLECPLYANSGHRLFISDLLEIQR